MSWLALPAPEPKSDPSDSVPPSQSAQKVQHDPSFYLDHVVFQVETWLFKVPRRKFEEGSEVFQSMFALPSSGGVVEGQSDEHPLLLESISVDEFRSLLRAMFTPLYGRTLEESVVLSVGEWTHVLKLATMWSFDGLRRAAIVALRPLLEKDENSAQWLALAYKYEVHEWLLPSLHALARRPQALQVTEIDTLGIVTIVKIAEVRESFPFGGNGGGYRNSYTSRATHNFEEEIRRVFKDDLKATESKSSSWRGF